MALRYFNVYDPGHSGGSYSDVIDVFAEQARAGRDFTVPGDGSQTRDFDHVSDVVTANLLVATTEHVGEAVNVGTGRSVTIRELAEVVLTATGSSVEIVHTDPRPVDVDRGRTDLAAARDRLGSSGATSLEEGLHSLLGADPATATD